MSANDLLSSMARGSAIFSLIGAGATLSLIQFMSSVDGGPQGSMIGMVALSAFLLLLAAAVAGGSVGLQFRGDWLRSAAAGVATGVLGYIIQVAVLLGLLASLGGLLGLGPLGLSPAEYSVLAALGFPAAFASTVAALATSELISFGPPAPAGAVTAPARAP